MEKFEGKIAVSKFDLTRDDDGETIMSISMYDYFVKNKRLNILRRGCYKTPALIEYASMPAYIKERFEAKYGDPQKMLVEADEAIEIDNAARDYFGGALTAEGDRLTAEKIDEYTLNASVMNMLQESLDAQKAGRHRAGSRTKISWSGIWGISERLRDRTHHTLPKTELALKKKIYEYRKLGYECLISGKMGNKNTMKITPEGSDFLVALRRCRKPVYTLDRILEEYNRIAPSRKWTSLTSVDSIKRHLERPDIAPKWWAAVYGELAAKQKFDRKHRTQMPTMRDALWYGDGTRLNLYYKCRDKNGRLVKGTMMVYEVVDAYSEMLLGYHISTNENAEAQRRAFRMAIETAGHMPYEIVTDNQGGQKTDESKAFMRKICRISRTTAPYNPQSKTIEQIFGRFQRQVLVTDTYFTGMNITAKRRDSRPNREFIDDNVDALYTLDEMCERYAEYRERWNDMPHPRTGKSRRDMYYASVNAETQELSEYAMVDIFWQETEREVEFTASGIEIQVDGRSYAYEVFDAHGGIDYDFRKENTGRKFFVKYDPYDMTRVWLCVKTSIGTRRVCEAYPYAMIHRAMQEQTPEEQLFIRDTVDANKRMRMERRAQGYDVEQKHGVAPEQLGLRTSKLRGLSHRDEERIADEYLPSLTQTLEDDDMRCEPVSVGEAEKMLSNLTFDKVQLYNRY